MPSRHRARFRVNERKLPALQRSQFDWIHMTGTAVEKGIPDIYALLAIASPRRRGFGVEPAPNASCSWKVNDRHLAKRSHPVEKKIAGRPRARARRRDLGGLGIPRWTA